MTYPLFQVRFVDRHDLCYIDDAGLWQIRFAFFRKTFPGISARERFEMRAMPITVFIRLALKTVFRYGRSFHR
jgi:hypothetical protein